MCFLVTSISNWKYKELTNTKCSQDNLLSWAKSHTYYAADWFYGRYCLRKRVHFLQKHSLYSMWQARVLVSYGAVDAPRCLYSAGMKLAVTYNNSNQKYSLNSQWIFVGVITCNYIHRKEKCSYHNRQPLALSVARK